MSDDKRTDNYRLYFDKVANATYRLYLDEDNNKEYRLYHDADTNVTYRLYEEKVNCISSDNLKHPWLEQHDIKLIEEEIECVCECGNIIKSYPVFRGSYFCNICVGKYCSAKLNHNEKSPYFAKEECSKCGRLDKKCSMFDDYWYRIRRHHVNIGDLRNYYKIDTAMLDF